MKNCSAFCTVTKSQQNVQNIKNFSVLRSIKSYEGVIMDVTEEFSKILGWSSSHQAIGKTDYDIPSHACEFAEHFIRIDKLAIQWQKPILTIETQNFNCGWKTFLVEKKSIIWKEILSTVCTVMDVSETNLGLNFMLLKKNDEFLNCSKKPSIYILNSNYDPLNLTKRQQDCLFFFIRGKVAKEIANILKISRRTVERHLEIIKLNLDCCSKSQLIEKSIDSGFFYFVPDFVRLNLCEK